MKTTIRVRMTLAYCAIFCASALILESAAYFSLKSSLDALTDRELQARFIGVVDYMDHHIKRFTPARFLADLKSHGALQPELLSIVDRASGPVFVAEKMRGLVPTTQAQVTTVSGNLPLRVLSSHQWVHGRDYELLLATDLSVPSAVMNQFRWILILSAPLMLTCASLAGYWISGHALAPVSELIRAARTISAANLSERVTVPQSGDEIEELATTLNGMIARIESAFHHVTQFTADASHELRTPLAVMRATSEVALLNTSGNSETYRQALHRILREAEKNTILLDNLLRLARADSAGRTVVQKPVNLGRKLALACERIRLLAEEQGVLLNGGTGTEPFEKAFSIQGDADHLLRLCLILLDNGIKYTPAGGSVAANVTRVGSMVRLEVRDTGIGIPEADLPKIFGRFFRTDEARVHGAGSGLGLAIAQWIIEAHRASIHVHSSLGNGTTFRIDFPAMSQPLSKETASSGAVAQIQYRTTSSFHGEAKLQNLSASSRCPPLGGHHSGSFLLSDVLVRKPDLIPRAD